MDAKNFSTRIVLFVKFHSSFVFLCLCVPQIFWRIKKMHLIPHRDYLECLKSILGIVQIAKWKINVQGELSQFVYLEVSNDPEVSVQG